MKKGFTLVELMIVVAIIGTLAVIAIPSYQRFVLKSKISEGLLNMESINKGAIAWYNQPHNDMNGSPLAKHFPHGYSPTTVPLSPYGIRTPGSAGGNDPCQQGKAMYTKNVSNWRREPWLSLGFSVNKAHYFQYRYSSAYTEASAEFNTSAVADLDCDGTFSFYTQRGAVSSSTGDIEINQVRVITWLSGFGDPLE